MPRRPVTDPTVAVAYLRVSTDDQTLGPQAQRAAIARWAASQGVSVVAWFEDHGISGGAPLDKRPALVDALDALADHGAGVLVVAKRDRLARDVMVSAMVERLAERAGARVVSAAGEGNGDDPTAVLMRRIVDAFSEYERALIKARTRAALRVKADRGERVGAVPVGCAVADDGRTLVADPREARAVALIQELRADGMTIRAIADALNARGVPARGRRWHPTTVARVLRRAEAAA